MSDKYDTNLASEYHVLSVLYRQGAGAYLTLGNKKAVDILVRKGGRTLTIDVKGIKRAGSWIVDNMAKAENHYIAFVSFLGRIKQVREVPEVYVIPSDQVEAYVRINPSGRRNIGLGKLRADGQQYRDNWKPFI